MASLCLARHSPVFGKGGSGSPPIGDFTMFVSLLSWFRETLEKTEAIEVLQDSELTFPWDIWTVAVVVTSIDRGVRRNSFPPISASVTSLMFRSVICLGATDVMELASPLEILFYLLTPQSFSGGPYSVTDFSNAVTIVVV